MDCFPGVCITWVSARLPRTQIVSCWLRTWHHDARFTSPGSTRCPRSSHTPPPRFLQVCRIFVWLVSASSIAMTWNLSPLPAFRFSRPKDIGVTVYLCLVSVWFLQQLPAPILAPVFFADPAGAVIGVQTCQCAMYVLHNNVSFRSRKGGEQAIPEAESSLVPKEDCSRKSSCTSVHLF